MTTRRRLIHGLAAAGAMTGLGWPRRGEADEVLPAQIDRVDYKILEIFMFGAYSHQETLWGAQHRGDDDWRGLPDVNSISADLDNRMFEVGPDAQGRAVHMGCCMRPFGDLMNRMRVVALGHENTAHHPASAEALTGLSGSRPNSAGLGARVSARHGGGSSVVIPTRGGPQMLYASSTGMHGVHCRPHVLPVYSARFLERLRDRDRFDGTDPLVAHYRDRYVHRLTHREGPVRSDNLSIYATGVEGLVSGDVEGMLEDFEAVEYRSYAENPAVNSIGLAVDLLTNEPAVRHACVVVAGHSRSFLDTHSSSSKADHATIHNGAMWSVLQGVASSGLNLDNTMVVIHTEFGRMNLDNNGTEHAAEGYAIALIGGPIPTGGPTLAGSIDFSIEDTPRAADGFSGQPFSQADLMAALVLVAGADPFQEGFFSLHETTLGDVATNAEHARSLLAQTFLGLS